METLFIFGTNRTALESVFQGLDQEKEKEEGSELALEVNQAAIPGQACWFPFPPRRTPGADRAPRPAQTRAAPG